MAAEEIYTWDITTGGGARRPSLSDLGDAQLEDQAPPHAPPKTGSHLYAAKMNQETMQTFGAAQMIPSVRMTIDFASSTPFIDRFTAPGTLLTSTSFALTDNGAGDTTISWAAGVIPALDCDPKAWMGGTGSWLAPVVEVVSATSVRVRTRNNSNTLADGRVTIELV